MHHHIAIIQNDPTRFGSTLRLGGLMMPGFDFSANHSRQTLEHSPAGTAGNHKIIGKGSDPLDIQNKDIFAFFIFQ